MKLKKHIHGFNVPEDYFDTLQERIMLKAAMEDLPKESGMRVPENYFEHLESRIVTNSTKAKTRKESKSIRLNTWWYAVAAACTVAFGLWLAPETPKTNSSTKTIVDTNYSLEYYIEDMVLDIPDSSLYNLIDNIHYTDRQASFSDKINKEEVEEYLMENLDLSTLLSYE